MRMKRYLIALLILATTVMLLSGASAAAKGSIQLGGKLGFMFVDGNVTLRPKLVNINRNALTYTSSDTSVLTVSNSGAIHAVGVGRAVITVTDGKVKAKCGVVVLPKQVSVQVGESVDLPNGTLERYAVKDKPIASIGKTGRITGLKAGNTQVAVKYGRQLMILDVEVQGGQAPGDETAEDPRISGLEALSQTEQIVLVEYNGGSSATLSVHERTSTGWKMGFETAAYVGKNGIGKTVEGDKKTPTGTYNLTTPFGILADPGANMPYTKVTKYHYWCGTSSSEYYNQLVDSRVSGRAYTSSDEHLIDYGSVYNYCMFIDYNVEGVAGKGSCIFLHCTGSNKYTAGCVAVSEEVMKKIIQWARPGVKIVIK